MPMIGADLAAMDRLGSRFGAASAQFTVHTGEIANEVRTALDEFVARMRVLDGKATELGGELDTEMRRLETTAANTAWTGATRQRHDEAVASISANVAHIGQAIDTFAGEASAVVDGELAAGMSDLQAGARDAGRETSAIADRFQQAVAQQRTNFDHVMNG